MYNNIKNKNKTPGKSLKQQKKHYQPFSQQQSQNIIIIINEYRVYTHTHIKHSDGSLRHLMYFFCVFLMFVRRPIQLSIKAFPRITKHNTKRTETLDTE